MNSETKICQNCKQNFTIESEDFDFYEKVKVPEPTWCWECRTQRRMLWENIRTLYKRVDNRTGKVIFAMIAPGSSLKVWERDDWWSDVWNPLDYGRIYDWESSFLNQFYDLSRDIPWFSRSVLDLVRSEYCSNATSLKDCYLVFGSNFSENSAYCDEISHCKDCFDSSLTTKGEVSYESFFNQNCFRSFFSSHCENSHDIIFCRDCVGVANCFGCVGLRNKSYHIFNKPHSKEDYKKSLANLDIGSYEKILEFREDAYKFWLKYPVKFMRGRHSTGATGEYISNSKNLKNCYHIDGGENLKYCQSLYTKPTKDSYDYSRFGNNSELVYESIACGHNISRLKFCFQCYPNSSNLSYCVNCHNCNNLFGCIGLRNKQYCILNKQYSKEEYERLVPRIIEHMNQMPYADKKGRVYKYGEFFPPELSPFCYNETIAQEYFPLTKEQALEQGYSWKDPEPRNYQIDLKTADITDHIKDVKDDIVGKVIECENSKSEIRNPKQILSSKSQILNPEYTNCTTAFKIIPEELAFYRRMNIPLPRLCPNCRHYQRLKQKNPLKLWQRQCQCGGSKSSNGVYQNTGKHEHKASPCPNTFETSYAPDRPEIVYCEQCYLQEVV